ncbi:MAG: hypothetical protein D6726_03775 [Nitrospirae bacterium]|nr:MAG: hypothetical protein D6726_03775 [Nitrospirota bacterium]
MNLFLHICCANCAIYPVTVLRERGVEIKGFWYNPNIHPFTEYSARLDALKKLAQLWDIDMDYHDHYGLKEFVRAVVYDEKNRCEKCYRIRLEKTVRKAKDKGFEAFTTTLLFSPYQDRNLILETGMELQESFDIEFLGEDFRPGWKEGNRISRELGLYRQKYCGCIYSEMERYLKKKAS